MPGLLRRVLIASLGSVIVAGVLQDLLRPTFAAWGPLAVINDWLFTANGLTTQGALTLFILIAVITLLWARKGKAVQASIETPAPERAADPPDFNASSFSSLFYSSCPRSLASF